MAQPELDRLLIHNLADLDAAAKYVEELGRNVDAALAKLLEAFIREARWTGEPNNLKSTWMAPEGWRKPADHVGHNFKCHFFIDTRTKNGTEDYDFFWLTRLVGIGFQNVGLRWKRNDVTNKRQWKSSVAQQSAIIDRLRARGFEHEQAEASFFLPIRIDQSALAKAVFDESPELALTPFNDALQTCVNAKPDFDALL